MGLSRVRALDIESDGAYVEQPGLWTRGGINGVQVRFKDSVINIPRDAILELLAAEYVSVEIARLEQMTTEQVISAMMSGKGFA